MGCHTWVYKKISALTDEEKNLITKDAVESVEGWWGFKQTREKIIETLGKWYKKQPETFNELKDDINGYADRMIAEYTERSEKLKKGGFDAAIEMWKNDGSAFVHTIDGEDYWNIDFDTPFRLYGYPEEEFKDKQSLLKYLKECDSKNLGYYNDEDEFVRGYSEELERRVNEYYKKHGEDNLYFEFG